MNEGKDRFSKVHVLLLPYPWKGHIYSLLQFAKILASKGLKVTLATTHHSFKSIQAATGVSIKAISDGFDKGGLASAPTLSAYLEEFRTTGSRTLHDLIQKLAKSGSPVSCLVYDSFLHWAVDVAAQAGVPAAVFFANSNTVSALYSRAYHRLLACPMAPEAAPVTVPGLPPLEFSNLPSFFTSPPPSAYLEMVLNQFSKLGKARWIFGNSFEQLEAEVVRATSEIWPVKSIGPMVPSTYLNGRIKGDYSFSAENQATTIGNQCVDWLDAKPKGSVVYVSVDSLVEFSPKEMDEIAWGLDGCGKPFLWGVQQSRQSKLPEGYLDSIKEKGLVVSLWSQLQVLAHQSVGCFVTHCGWNSTLEALSLGVPMVGVPQWADQPTNAKLVEGWGVGLRARVDGEGTVRREAIEFCIREVVEGERGKEIKRNARKWRELAKEAMDKGGSSDRNIEDFVEELLKGEIGLVNGIK